MPLLIHGVTKTHAYFIGAVFIMLNFTQFVIASVILTELMINHSSDSPALSSMDYSRLCNWAIIFGLFGIISSLILVYGLVNERRAGCQFWWRYVTFCWWIHLFMAVFLPISIPAVAAIQIFSGFLYAVAIYVVWEVAKSFDNESPLFRQGNYFHLPQIFGRKGTPAESAKLTPNAKSVPV